MEETQIQNQLSLLFSSNCNYGMTQTQIYWKLYSWITVLVQGFGPNVYTITKKCVMCFLQIMNWKDAGPNQFLTYT
jgi:hypothetical protein